MPASAKPKVLFLCTGNACRSQMAEGWLRHLAGERFAVGSAGLEAHGLDPRTVAAMAAAGVDVGAQRSETIERHLDEPPDLVVTVCDHAARHRPPLPRGTRLLHWPFPDPAREAGFAAVCAAIRGRIERWLDEGAPFA